MTRKEKNDSKEAGWAIVFLTVVFPGIIVHIILSGVFTFINNETELNPIYIFYSAICVGSPALLFATINHATGGHLYGSNLFEWFKRR